MTENATVSHSHTHALEATGLKKHYGPRNVVKGVSLAVKSGEVVGLLGKNGAGKTTTFYMVVGLVVADDGQIRLDQKKLATINACDPQSIARRQRVSGDASGLPCEARASCFAFQATQDQSQDKPGKPS